MQPPLRRTRHPTRGRCLLQWLADQWPSGLTSTAFARRGGRRRSAPGHRWPVDSLTAPLSLTAGNLRPIRRIDDILHGQRMAGNGQFLRGRGRCSSAVWCRRRLRLPTLPRRGWRHPLDCRWLWAGARPTGARLPRGLAAQWRRSSPGLAPSCGDGRCGRGWRRQGSSSALKATSCSWCWSGCGSRRRLPVPARGHPRRSPICLCSRWPGRRRRG